MFQGIHASNIGLNSIVACMFLHKLRRFLAIVGSTSGKGLKMCSFGCVFAYIEFGSLFPRQYQLVNHFPLSFVVPSTRCVLTKKCFRTDPQT